MDAVIQPIIPQSPGVPPGTSPQIRRPLPIPDVPPRRSSAVVYGMTVMDSRGRIANQAVLRALNWTAGICLTVESVADLLVLRPDLAGEVSVTTPGHLRLPAATRHRHGLSGGDRLLLAADPAHGQLVVCPPVVLETLITGLMGGDQA